MFKVFLIALLFCIFACSAEEEIIGMRQSRLTDKQKSFLSKHGFCVVPQEQTEQMYQLYNNSSPYITIDSAIVPFYRLLGETMRVIEEKNAQRLTRFCELLYTETEYRKKPDNTRLLMFAAIPHKILSNKKFSQPLEQLNSIDESTKSGIEKLFRAYDAAIDIKQFTLPGIYETDMLNKYAAALFFFSKICFDIEDQQKLECSLQILSIFRRNRELADLYNQIENTYSFFIGNQSDSTVNKYLTILNGFNELKTSNFRIKEILDDLHNSQKADTLKNQMTGKNELRPKTSLCLFGRYYNTDDQFFGQVFRKLNQKPTGIDYMSGLGNNQARKIVAARNRTVSADTLNTLTPANENPESITGLLTGLIQSGFSANSQAMAHFKTPLYEKRLLNTALSNWTLKKHLSVLPPKELPHLALPNRFDYIYGSVEPIPGFFEKLQAIVKKITGFLKNENISAPGQNTICCLYNPSGDVSAQKILDTHMYYPYIARQAYELGLRDFYSQLEASGKSMPKLFELMPLLAEKLKKKLPLSNDENKIIAYYQEHWVIHL